MENDSNGPAASAHDVLPVSTGGPLRRRSLSPSLLMKNANANTNHNKTRPPLLSSSPNTPLRRSHHPPPLPSPQEIMRHRSSPSMTQSLIRELYQYHPGSSSDTGGAAAFLPVRRHSSADTSTRSEVPETPPRHAAQNDDEEESDASIILSPVYLQHRYLNPDAHRVVPPRGLYAMSDSDQDEEESGQGSKMNPSVAPSPSSNASSCSAPSSPFMDLIYSTSGSTVETPDILRALEETDKETPVMRNTRQESNLSSSSTLQSTAPRNYFQQQQSTSSVWVVPRLQTQTPSRQNQEQHQDGTPYSGSSGSPFSLPSLLGPPARDPDPQDDQVSALESPMVSITNTEATDIHSMSQATDIKSLQTKTEPSPKAEDGNLPIETPRPASPTASTSTTGASADEPPSIHRCNAHDEMDDTDVDSEMPSENMSSPSANTNAKPTTPNLTQLASVSGFWVSAEEVIEAAYPEDSSWSDTFSLSVANALPPQTSVTPLLSNSNQESLFREAAVQPPAPSPRWAVGHQVLYHREDCQSGNHGQDDEAISELSSQWAESSRFGNEQEEEETSGFVVTEIETGGDQDEDLAKMTLSTCGSATTQRSFFPKSRLGMFCRLVTICVLALAVVVPLIVVLIHMKNQADGRDFNQIQRHENERNSSEPSSSPSLSPSAVPMREPTTISMPSPPTVAPVLSESASTTAPTMVPTVVPTANPTSMELPPTLPPFAGIWNEYVWQQEDIVRGPQWPHKAAEGSSLELTVINSFSDDEDVEVLQTVLDNWQNFGSNVLQFTLDTPKEHQLPSLTETEECTPLLGHIRMCNGHFQNVTARSRFFSEIYIDDQEMILAVVIYRNDAFGLAALKTSASVQYALCHEFGHALGLAHSSRGCMKERFDLSDLSSGGAFMLPDSWNFSQLDEMYGPPRARRVLRRRRQ